MVFKLPPAKKVKTTAVHQAPPRADAPFQDPTNYIDPDPAADERQADLSKQRSLRVQEEIPDTDPGVFADSVTWGLQAPVAGAVAALAPWMHPDTTMAERYQGGVDDYRENLARQINEAGPVSSTAQQIAGGLITGGVEGSLLKQGAFDAAAGGVQSLASGESYRDSFLNALVNAGMGGAFNAGGAGIGKARGFADNMDDMLRDVAPREWR